MSLAKVKVAVVEDNGMARTNIRNHLLDMGFSQISCFSNGRELKANMKKSEVRSSVNGLSPWSKIKTV